MDSKWLKIAGTLMVGLFVAYLDRINLSIGLTSISKDLGFTGESFAVTSSLALTTFLIGYAGANIFGGVLTRRFDPKWVAVAMMAIWSVATLLTGWVASVTMLLGCRLVLGIAEGIYWPQQSRFVKSWFSQGELTRANSLIQFYGQYLALAIGFVILGPIYDNFGWQALFFVTGGLGLFIMVPLYLKLLGSRSTAPYVEQKPGPPAKLTLKAMGGWPILLLIFSYITQGMLFWGITLWLPLALKSIGITGIAASIGSALPYLAAVVLAIPLSIISDRTGKRVLIAALGLLLPGILLMFIPAVDNGYLKLAIVTVSLGYYAASYTPNIWSVIQSNVEPEALGAASGIINGLGAGCGGTMAGWLVGMLYKSTGSYMFGYVSLGVLVILGGIALLAFGKIRSMQASAAGQAVPSSAVG
jgi:MFS family permease